jgi:hypothetical protein
MAMTTPSHADLIGQYITLRNYVEAQTRAHNEKMEQYTNAMAAIEAYMGGQLQEQAGSEAGKSSIATPQGTCFRKLQTSVKIVDRDTFMDFVFDGRREGFITNHVSKDAVTEYLEQFKSVPPGIDISTRWAIQFNSPRSDK